MYEVFARLIQQRGITPYRVHKDTGVAQSTLSDWKNGKGTPSADKLKKIADYLGVTIEYILTGEDQKSKEKLLVNDDEETSVVAYDLVPYCMRHTYATDLQTAGVPINVAKDLLGHKNITMTARIYTRLSEEAFSSAAAKVYALDDARASGKIASLYG